MPLTPTKIQSFPELPSDFKDAAELVQKQLEESIASLDTRMATLEHEYKRRKLTATTLKVISVISSLVVLSGVGTEGLAQILGGAILESLH